MTFAQWHVQECKKMPSDNLNKVVQDLRTNPEKVKQWILSNLEDCGLAYVLQTSQAMVVNKPDQMADWIIEEMKKEWIKEPV